MNSTNALRMFAALAAVSGLLSAVPASAQVVGAEGWTRAAASKAAGVGYLVLTNHGSEEAKLLKMVSPVSDRVTIHRSSIDENGVARMWAVGKLAIAPGESVRFDPSGLHVMFTDLKVPFVAGQKVPLQLTFEHQAEFTVMLEVRPLVAAAGTP